MTSGLLVRAAAVAQVFVEDVEHPELASDDSHHLAKVLRLRAGESVVATNGTGNWCLTEWNGSRLEVTGAVEFEVPPADAVSVAFALTKGEKPEWTVQKLTEIGVDRIAPFISDRTIVRWDAEKSAKHAQRFRRVAHEAAMQSRRVYIPAVADVVAFASLSFGETALAVPGSTSDADALRSVAIGPEGGWSDDELKLAQRTINLGPTILRAETAALAAAVQLCSARS